MEWNVSLRMLGGGVDANHIEIEVLCLQKLMAGTWRHDGLEDRFISSWERFQLYQWLVHLPPPKEPALLRAY